MLKEEVENRIILVDPSSSNNSRMKEAAWQEWRKYNDTKYVAKAKVTAAVELGDVNDGRNMVTV